MTYLIECATHGSERVILTPMVAGFREPLAAYGVREFASDAAAREWLRAVEIDVEGEAEEREAR